MTLTIKLPARVEAALIAEAEAQGRSAEEVATEKLTEVFDLSGSPRTSTAPQMLSETLAGRLGKFRTSEPSDASERTGQIFAEGIAERRRQERL